MQKLSFAGHESFHCRHFWLKKGYDYVTSKGKFNDESAVVSLGVGKNMVLAIRYWLKAFDLLDETENPTKLSNSIFASNGWDPFLEDEGTLWLLHYQLNKKGLASIFQIVFSELRKSKPEFTRKNFTQFVHGQGTFSDTTLTKDFTVFQNTYLASSTKNEIEDSYSGILTELNLIQSKKSSHNDEVLVIESKRRPEVPASILFYAILDSYPESNSISIEQLFNDSNSVGSIFALSREGLTEKIEELIKERKDVTFKNDAGIRELQLKSRPRPMTVLEHYYNGR